MQNFYAGNGKEIELGCYQYASDEIDICITHGASEIRVRVAKIEELCQVLMREKWQALKECEQARIRFAAIKEAAHVG